MIKDIDMIKDIEPLLIEILGNTDAFPFWNKQRNIFWILPQQFGIGLWNNNIICQYNGRRRVFTPKTFFLKPRLIKTQEDEIRNELNQLMLFIEQKHGTLRARDITSCRNAEYRRILMQRFGYEKFLKEMDGIVIHREGENSLVRIDWHRDEQPMKLVRVKDASTDRFYVLRVPPETKTCREGISWTFGLNESEYHPVKET
jgi:hypothetical protein